AFLLVLTPPSGRSDETEADKLAKIRTRMQAFVDQQEIAGAVTILGRKDAILCCDGVGSMNLDKKQAMTKDALFRIASMTKPITAIAVMILAEEGKLSIEDPVEKHLPAFRGQMVVASRTADTVTLKKPERPITLRDLLTHTSGLPGSPPSG